MKAYTKNRSVKGRIIHPCDMHNGEFGVLVNSDYDGIIVLKHGYCGLVSINSDDSWAPGGGQTLHVKMLEPGEAITITQGGR